MRKKEEEEGDREERVGKKQTQNLTHIRKGRKKENKTHCECTKLPKKLSN